MSIAYADLPVVPVRLPAVLAGQRNGELPAAILERVPGVDGGADVILVRPAARAWRALHAAMADRGHVLKISHEPNAYRTLAIQTAIFRARYTTTPVGTRPRFWNGRAWYKLPGVATAAVPGTSNHGRGIAIDVGVERDGDAGTEPTDRALIDALAPIAVDFGWSWELVPEEPWHLRYYAGDHVPRAVIEHERRTTMFWDCPITIGADTDTGKTRVAYAGEGSTLVDEAAHWIEVVETYRETGILASPHLDVLIYKIRMERAESMPQPAAPAPTRPGSLKLTGTFLGNATPS